VGELLFWGYFAKKYKRFGESETFWQSGKTLYYLAKVGSYAK